jgi:uncharacterized repeat protein (TIGR01451 family)
MSSQHCLNTKVQSSNQLPELKSQTTPSCVNTSREKETNQIIVVVDSSLDDYSFLVAGVISPCKVIVLDHRESGIAQITEILRTESHVRELHLLSHGSPGCLYLGNTELKSNDLDNYFDELQSWKQAFSKTSQIFLYGCHLALDKCGQSFVQKLHDFLGIGIAATNTIMGNHENHKSWDFPVQIGSMHPSQVLSEELMLSYSGFFGDLSLSWANSIGSLGRNSGTAIATDDFNNVYAVGRFTGEIDINDDGIFDLVSQETTGLRNGYIVKFNENGDLTWSNTIDDTSTASDVEIDSLGNAYIVGSQSNRITDLGSSLIKYSPQGEVLLRKDFDLSSANSIGIDSTENIYIAGSVDRSVDLNGDGEFDLLRRPGSLISDSYLLKLNGDGSLIWSLQFNSSQRNSANSIAVDPFDNIYVTGRFSGSVDLNNDGNFDLVPDGRSDAYIAKFSDDGSLIWAESIGGSGDDVGTDITVDNFGNVYATGRVSGGLFGRRIDINNNGVNDLVLGEGTSTYIVEFDSSGNLLWSKDILVSSSSRVLGGRGIYVDDSGNIYNVGSFAANVDINGDGFFDLQPTERSSTVPFSDGYLLKFDDNKNLVYAKKIGDGLTDSASDIAIDQSGFINVIGSFTSSNIDLTNDGTPNLFSGGGDSDAYIIEFQEIYTLEDEIIEEDESMVEKIPQPEEEEELTSIVEEQEDNSTVEQIPQPEEEDGLVSEGDKLDDPDFRFINLSPLNIYLIDTEFSLNTATNREEASGTFQIGLENSPSPLLQVNGSISYDQESIQVDGLMSALVGETNLPLFTGGFQIEVGQTDTLTLNDTTPDNQETVELAGLDLKLNGLEFTAEGLAFQSQVNLPTELGDFAFNVTDPNRILINDQGISVTGGSINFPDIDWRIANLLRLKAEDLQATYLQEEGIILQGKVELPEVFNLTGNLVGTEDNPNYIRINADQDPLVDLRGSISTGGYKLIPNVWELRSAEVFLDTSANEIQGDASLLIPTGIVLEGGLGFIENQINYLSLGASELNQPIGTTGIFLQSISGQIDNIASSDTDLIEFLGQTEMTAGAEVNLSLPSWLGGNVSGSVLGLGLEALIDPERLSGSGDITLLGGLARGNGQAELNWNQGTLTASTSFNILDSFIQTQSDFKATSSLDIGMAGSASVNIPSRLPFGGTQLGSGNFALQFTNDNNLSNDFIAGWGEISNPIPFASDIVIGVQVDFDGSWSTIGASEIPKTNSFYVEPETEYLLLNASWENNNQDLVEVQVIDPQGNIYQENEFESQGFYILDDLSNEFQKTVLINTPTEGIWDLQVIDDSGIGTIETTAFRDASQSVIEITGLESDETGAEITINYDAFSTNEDTQISLFYDTKNSGTDGILIADYLLDSQGSGSFTWDTQGLVPGDYYVYGMISGGDSIPSFGYSSEPVSIKNQADLSITKTVTSESPDTNSVVTYKIEVENQGDITSEQVSLNKSLPTGASLVSASLDPVFQSDTDLIFDIGDLAGGETNSIEVTLDISSVTDALSTRSQVSSKTFDPNFNNDFVIIDGLDTSDTTEDSEFENDTLIGGMGDDLVRDEGESTLFILDDQTAISSVESTNNLTSRYRDFLTLFGVENMNSIIDSNPTEEIEIIAEFNIESDTIGLSTGVEFDDLVFTPEGNNTRIELGDKTLAIIEDIDSISLRNDVNFIRI